MKNNIHPKYHNTKVICTTCGAEFETGSVLPEIKGKWALYENLISTLA